MRMMIERLIKGDRSVADNFAAAARLWRDLLKQSGGDVDKLARFASDAQPLSFEAQCGHRRDAQEAMGIVGIAMHYETQTGFSDEGRRQAKLVRDAIAQSTCSSEVKSWAKDTAKLYGLDER